MLSLTIFPSLVACTGGAPKYPQIKAIESGVQVVIATPGRLNDIMAMGKVVMSNVMTLALDEADRMLDMGFEPQIRTIIDMMPTKRQTLFFTATWPKEVQRLARDFVQNPVRITVGDAGKLNANKSIKQHIQVSYAYVACIFDAAGGMLQSGGGSVMWCRGWAFDSYLDASVKSAAAELKRS